MIRASVSNDDTLTLTGIPEEVPASRVREWADDIGTIINERIAADFESELGAGRKLGSVSEAHEQRKARDGLDDRRGHMHGYLQDALDQGGLYRVGSFARGRITVTMDENRLIGRVSYAGYYAEAKVKGGKLLVILPKDATKAAAYIQRRVDEYLKVEDRRASTGRQQRAAVRAGRGRVRL